MFIFIYLCLLPKFSYLRFLHNSEMTRLFTMDIALGIQMTRLFTMDIALGIQMTRLFTMDIALGIQMTRLFTMDIALGIQTNPTNMIYDYPADTR